MIVGELVMSQLAIRLWNGPFFAGVRPDCPTIGWVLLKVLESFWRLTICFLVLGLIIAGAVYFYDKANPPLGSQIDALITPDAAECKATIDRPLLLKLTNRSVEAVGKTTLSISAFEKGQSTDLIEFNYKDFDGVIRPKSWISYCLPTPVFNRQATRPVAWTAKISYASSLDDDYVEQPAVEPNLNIPIPRNSN